jgi:hypothetical protein
MAWYEAEPKSPTHRAVRTQYGGVLAVGVQEKLRMATPKN